MAGSFSNSWALVKASADVLRMDKELLVFPLLSGVATVLVMVSFFVPMLVLGGWPALAEMEGTYLGYAAIAATVGMLLRAISERSGFLGRIAVGLVGMGGGPGHPAQREGPPGTTRR